MPAARQVMGIDSYCVSCEENGKTNVLMTRIPFFREVIVMAFNCRHCGFRSSEVQSASCQEKGSLFELTVTTPRVCC
jgi:zinc finger protein